MKAQSSPYTWTFASPHRAGWYWYRSDEDCYPQPLLVFKAPGEVEWSVQWGPDEESDVDFCLNEHGQWAGPIHEPIEPIIHLEPLD